MKAAIVESYDCVPTYGDVVRPDANNGEVTVDVRAAALSQLVRVQASGKHYSSPGPPFVPGVDGVGTLAGGQRVYFAFPRSPTGAMAEQTVVNTAYTTSVPEELDDVMVAAIANPGMSSWAALTRRAFMKPGESVLINGATGASGRLAVQIAHHLGAARILATGRNVSHEADLLGLGADVFIPLGDSQEALTERLREEIGKGVDIVLDYLWGAPAEAIIRAVAGSGSGQAAPRVRFVNIGSLAGMDLSLPAGVLRSSGVEVMGSGLGSVSNAELVDCIGEMLSVISEKGFAIATEAVPLVDIEQVWAAQDYTRRVVFTL